MAVEYKSDSPYANTEMYSYYLDVLTPRVIRPFADDVLHTLTQVHEYRPDLLAFEMYGSARLWWVFAHYNRDTLRDPIMDFTSGTKIVAPKTYRATRTS